MQRPQRGREELLTIERSREKMEPAKTLPPLRN
jgi:hypothetical protein